MKPEPKPLSWHQQWTLRRAFTLLGHGLHSGRPVELVVLPAEPDTGISFVRTDLPGSPAIPALAEHVVDTTLSTTLGRDLTRVQTVEHLLAALSALGVSNAQVLVDGPELPAMDGSALPYVRAIQEAGLVAQKAKRNVIATDERLELTMGDRSILYLPAETPRITYVVDFDHPLVGAQLFEQDLTPEVFATELAGARTFCLEREFQRMRKAGLAKGGTVDNAILVQDSGYSSPLRFADEFVRHKVLDLVGDLALLGASWCGHIVAVKAGHPAHVRFAAMLRDAAFASRPQGSTYARPA